MSESLPVEDLQELPFLRDMLPKHLQEIAHIATFRDFDEGNIVFREGDAAKRIYFVISGNVSLEFCAAGSGCKQILTLGSGDLLGWSALFNEARYTARARIIQSARLMEIDVAQLLGLCECDFEFGYELMRRSAVALANRLSATRMQLVNTYEPQLPTAPS